MKATTGLPCTTHDLLGEPTNSSLSHTISRLIRQTSPVTLFCLFRTHMLACTSNSCRSAAEEYIKKVKQHAITCARISIPSVSSVARAGVTPYGVAASCMKITPISAVSTFISICSLQFKTVELNVTTKCVCNQQQQKFFALKFLCFKLPPNSICT